MALPYAVMRTRRVEFQLVHLKILLVLILKKTGEMALLETIPGVEDYIRKHIIEDRATQQVVDEELKLQHPWISRGLSSRSIRRFCEVHDFYATSRLADNQFDMMVKTSTSIHKVSLKPLPGMAVAIYFFTLLIRSCTELSTVVVGERQESAVVLQYKSTEILLQIIRSSLRE